MGLIKFALKNGADDVTIEIIKENATQIKFANSSISICQDWSTVNYKIFVAVKNAVAASTFQGLPQSKLRTAVKNLIAAAKKSKPSAEYLGLAKGPFKYRPIGGLYDKKVAYYNGPDAIEAAIGSADCRNSAGFFYKDEIERKLETSGGVSVSEKKTKLQMSIRAFNEQDESGHALSCSRSVKGFRPEEAGTQAGETADLGKRPVQAKPGKYDVVFAPMAIGNLLSRLGEFSLAFNVDSGFSCLNKMGDHVASRTVNITDDGRLGGGFNSSLFDDEGAPTTTTRIIGKGVLETYLHNTSSAKKYKTKTTGNSGTVGQRYHNIILEPGKKSKDKLLGIDNGILVTNVWYTRFQSFYTGDFSTIPRDSILVIKNGKLDGAVKNVRITDNMLNIFRNIKDISNKLHCTQWWEEINPSVYTPYVLAKNVNITLPTI